MVVSEWSSCPSCKMVANYQDFKRVLESEPTCPMCEEPVPPMTIKISDNAEGDFKALAALMKDPTEKKEDGEGGGDLDSDDDNEFIK